MKLYTNLTPYIEIIFVCFPQFLLKSLSYIRDEMNTYNIIITG